MALPSSGQISFNDVRTEMSQSAKAPYEMSGWTWGSGSTAIPCVGVGEGYTGYTPINILSSGSRFSESNPLQLSNLSMSAWYDYDRSLYIGLEVTGTLYQHADVVDKCYPSTMLPIEIGTSDINIIINISGSITNGAKLYIWYGKPWNDNGSFHNYPSILIFSGYYYGNTITGSFPHGYTYDANLGTKFYCVLTDGCL
jgi:hypothetical protein